MREKRHARPDGGLARLIELRRVILRMSHEKIAKKAGFDPSLSWQLEIGRTANPKVMVLFGLAQALRVSFEDVCRAALIDAQCWVEKKPVKERRPEFKVSK